MRSTNLLHTAICVNLHLLSSVSHAFTTTTTTASRFPSSSSSSRRTAGGVVAVGSAVAAPTSPSSSETFPAASSSSSSSDRNDAQAGSSSSPPSPTWESKQHLYGVDCPSIALDLGGEVAGGGGGAEALPLPQTYVTCGRCNSLFAIAEEDLGRGKGW